MSSWGSDFRDRNSAHCHIVVGHMANKILCTKSTVGHREHSKAFVPRYYIFPALYF